MAHHASGTSSAAWRIVSPLHASHGHGFHPAGNAAAAALTSSSGRLTSQYAHIGTATAPASHNSRRDGGTPCRRCSRSRRGRLARPSNSSVPMASVARGSHVRATGSILSQSASRGHSHDVRKADSA